MATEKRLIDADMLKANFPVLGEFAKDLWHAGTIRIAIDNALTVDAVEVVHGYWKRVPHTVFGLEDNFYHCFDYACSICGHHDDRHRPFKAPYCWCCGAKMDLEV